MTTLHTAAACDDCGRSAPPAPGFVCCGPDPEARVHDWSCGHGWTQCIDCHRKNPLLECPVCGERCEKT